MTTLIIEFDKNTPEIKQALDHLRTLSGVKIVPKKGVRAKSAWDTSIAEGAVSVDTFFDELDTRIKRTSAWDTAIAEGAVSVDAFAQELRRQTKEHFESNA